MARDKVEDEELNDHEKPYTNRSPTSSEDFGANGEKGDPSRRQSVINTKLQNPLSGMSYEELMDDVSLFAKQYDLQYAEDDLQKGALIAQKRSGFENMDRLTDEDKSLIREEKLHRWRQPRMMYYMTSRSRKVRSQVTVRANCWYLSSVRGIGYRTRYGSVGGQRGSSFLLPLLWNRG